MRLINSPPIVTLTTDFGLSDHYVGTMKGVILSRCPEAQIVDITHDLPPFSIYAGAYAIDQASRYFPPGSVHVIVVDPGVGTARQPLLVEASGQYFIAPDNGVLSFVLSGDAESRKRVITTKELWLDSPSATFHGRDVFAPVGASLAAGQVAPEQVGPPVEAVEMLPDLRAREVASGLWKGRVLSVDRFGNVVTSFELAGSSHLLHGRWSVLAGTQTVSQFRRTFADGEPGLCFAYAGSSGYLEIGLNRGSAAEQLQVFPGDPVELKTGN